MAEALLEVVLGNLNTLVQKELVTFWGVDGEIERLSSTLSAIRSVLADAEIQQTKNLSLKDWIRKLTDAAYVLDDILDECSIRPEIYGSSFLHPQNVLFRFRVGKKLKTISKRLDTIAEERQKFHLREGTTPGRAEVPEWRQIISLVTEPKVYGRDEDREKIVEFLVEHARHCGDDLSIYPIVGTGGVGKTTLAQLVFNDERVSHSFDFRVWVCVSDDFSIRKIMESIIDSASRLSYKNVDSDASNKITQPRIESIFFKALSEQNHNTSNLESLQNQVTELLQNRTYLLVLDDVWDKIEKEWERLKCILESGLKGSSILVTTRLVKTASIMGTVHNPHGLSTLSEDDCWSLFKQHAFGPDREESVNLVAIGKEIVRKCGGLPLAAKALGSLLHLKTTEKEWRRIRDSELWNLPGDDRILPALQLSYFNLDIQLRQCFAFCAIFPKDEEITKEHVIHLWMANGFISSYENSDVEDVGDEVWNELYQRSFFQDIKLDEWGNVRSFKMHDLIHDLAQSVMKNDCVATNHADLTNLPRNTHHIGFYSNQLLNTRIVDKKFESLWTFFQLGGNWKKTYWESQTFRSLRTLRARPFLLFSFEHLIHLRYLDLRCSFIRSLPESICNLRKLQTLKLTSCYDIYRLPQHLTRLHDLRHLIMEDCSNLRGLPPNIGKLTCLKTLTIFIVGSETGHRIAELCDLQLRGKLHIRGLQNVRSESEAKEANLVGKKHLDRLYLSWGMQSSSCVAEVEKVLDGLQPHHNLKSLGIQGYVGTRLPYWMTNISLVHGLAILILYDLENCQQLPALGKLRCLRRLYICGMKYIQHIDDSSYDYVADKAFPSLERLTLKKLPNLERMVKDEAVEMFPCLLELIISGVPELILPCIPSVERLDVNGCNDDKLMSISSYPNLKFLGLGDNGDLKVLPKEFTSNLCHLKTLCIGNFSKLEALSTELISLSELEELRIRWCDQLERFSLQGPSSLRTLEIECCQKLTSFSEEIRHLSSLERLLIWGCPELWTLSNGTNQLTALREVHIMGYHPRSKIPRYLERIPSLLSLHLSYFPDRTSLPDRLGDMISLQKLSISDCPELSSLPSSFQRLTNLQELSITSCPKVEKRCKKKTGEEWCKIQHIPQIQVGEESETRTVSDRIRFPWQNTRRVIRDLLPHSGDYHHSDCEFDWMIEKL